METSKTIYIHQRSKIKYLNRRTPIATIEFHIELHIDHIVSIQITLEILEKTRVERNGVRVTHSRDSRNILYRLRVRTLGLAGACWMAEEDRLGHNVAYPPDIHVHNP